MKQKRVDMWLSIASFLHLCLMGFGAFAVELVDAEKRGNVMTMAPIGFVIAGVAAVFIYSKVNRKTK